MPACEQVVQLQIVTGHQQDRGHAVSGCKPAISKGWWIAHLPLSQHAQASGDELVLALRLIQHLHKSACSRRLSITTLHSRTCTAELCSWAL